MSDQGLCVNEQLVRAARAAMESLQRAELTVVTAESCTGGLIATLLSYGERAADSLHGGFVVYTKDAKALALGVSRALLKEHGAVNADVAVQMVQGALQRSRADVALAVTGALGPNPDEDGIPPGHVCFCIARRNREPIVLQEHFADGDPDEVRRAVIMRALRLLRDTAQV